MSIGGVFAMLEFLSEYAPVIIAAAVLAALVIILAKKGMEREAKAIVLSLVAAAEQRFGGGTGEIKDSAVAAALYERLPSAARILLDEKTISYLIEDAVKKLKKYLSSENDALHTEDSVYLLQKTAQCAVFRFL